MLAHPSCRRRRSASAIIAQASRGWALVALALAGCTNAVLRPEFPDDSAPQRVKPLSAYTHPLKLDAPVVVKTFLVHGMSHSDSTWADVFIQQFAARLQVSVPLCSANDKISIGASPWADDPAKLCVVSGKVGQTEYVFYALQWSPLTDPYKCTQPFLTDRGANDPIPSADHPNNLLCGATSLAFPKRRAWINGVIKDHVLDDGFPDVLVYLAPEFQHFFWDVVSEGLCRMYSDDPRTPACVVPATTSRAGCGADVPAPTSHQTFVFITHSLGANILLDTFRQNLECERGVPPQAGVKLGTAIATTFERPTPYYMLANQYVLLQLHKATKDDFRSRRAVAALQTSPPAFDVRNHPFFAGIAARQRSQSTEPGGGRPKLDIDLVAFSDPNDDLTFLLPTGPPPIEGITVQNVFVPDAWEYFFVLENPDAAHVNYFRKPADGRILDVIVCGMDRSGVLPC